MSNIQSRILLALIFISVTVLSACQQEQPPQTETWDQFVTRQVEAHIHAHPQWAVTQGRHEFDGQLPDWSREAIVKEISRLHRQRDEALAFTGDQLNSEQLYQRDYLISRVDQDLFWMEKANLPFRSPQYYLGWMSDSLDPSAYIALDYAPLEERMAGFTRYLEKVPQAISQIRANLAMPMPRTWLQLGIDAFGGYAVYFRDDVPGVWSEVTNKNLQQAFADANTEAINAMAGMAEWLKSNLPTATEDFALGPELFRQMLWDTERVDISLAELEAIGRADMRRNLQNLEVACAEFAPGVSIQDCFALMSSHKPDEGSIKSARQQLQEARKFIVQQDLVSIPGDELAKVDEAPPYARSNFAYINIPGAWEKGQASVYYISPPNPQWPEAVQADFIAGEADLLFTSVHEVWPGHFLNFLHANRAEFFYGRVFIGYAFAEGWAHYTEELMIEAGLRGGDAETRIGQISNALLRDARFLSTIGLHTQGWSVEDSKQFFMREGFQSEGTAIQQAARGTYDPAYLNYTMGKLMIRQLRADWTAKRGGRKAWREFHDMFLSYGGPPIPLVRQQMLGEAQPTAVFPAH